jgi:hypothetical protein
MFGLAMKYEYTEDGMSREQETIVLHDCFHKSARFESRLIIGCTGHCRELSHTFRTNSWKKV